MRDVKRQHFMTREERAELWRKVGERNASRRRGALGDVPPEKDYEIVVRDGVELLVCPWQQELPPLGAEIYFWNILEELRQNLSEGTQDEFLRVLGKTDEASRSLVRAFCDFALEASHQAARERHRKRLEDIDDVRQAVGYYDEPREETPDE